MADHDDHAHPHDTTSHMHDPAAHVRAVEEDLEYYRTKRLEPRIFFLIRRGYLSLYDVVQAGRALEPPALDASGHLESRIRRLEDALDRYVRGTALVSSDLVRADAVIEDIRKERGDYDDDFRMTKRSHEGSLEERVARLEHHLAEDLGLLEAFTRALVQRTLLDESDVDKHGEASSPAGLWAGARIVARAWVDPEFKARLMTRGREAVRELQIPPGRLGKLGVVENTASVHNVVVCTLCSCYPHDLLGDTPWWYKHDSYKKRIVADPRATLRDMFQLELPSRMEIQVHDSTSDVRYMVLPRRPAGTEGMSEAELARLVTRDSLIGAGECLQPGR
ncbi:MAG TPA: nitrile hydratase subunit alpha [Methylomirabilota bacterium]|nr:nitrile hydratase subunit alpha [Methylomirabilota bacterium]